MDDDASTVFWPTSWPNVTANGIGGTVEATKACVDRVQPSTKLIGLNLVSHSGNVLLRRRLANEFVIPSPPRLRRLNRSSSAWKLSRTNRFRDNISQFVFSKIIRQLRLPKGSLATSGFIASIIDAFSSPILTLSPGFSTRR